MSSRPATPEQLEQVKKKLKDITETVLDGMRSGDIDPDSVFVKTVKYNADDEHNLAGFTSEKYTRYHATISFYKPEK